MKTEDYKIEYYREMLSCGFDEAGCFDNWSTLTKEQQSTIIETVIGGIENQSMAFGYVDTKGADSYEVTTLKKQLAEAKKDAEEWRTGFEKNVSRRRGWDQHEVWVSKDGEAGNTLIR